MTRVKQDKVSLDMGARHAKPTFTVRVATPNVLHVPLAKARLQDLRALTIADPLWILRLSRVIPVQAIEVSIIFAAIATQVLSVLEGWTPSVRAVTPAKFPTGKLNVALSQSDFSA
jgi:uncharacterized membrane protein